MFEHIPKPPENICSACPHNITSLVLPNTCVSTQAVVATSAGADAESCGDDVSGDHYDAATEPSGDDTTTAQALQHTCNGTDDVWDLACKC